MGDGAYVSYKYSYDRVCENRRMKSFDEIRPLLQKCNRLSSRLIQWGNAIPERHASAGLTSR
jgi:hypothetical protein